MKSLFFKVATFFYKLLTKSKFDKFERSLDSPKEAQEKTLMEIMSILNATSYGQSLGHVRSYKDYANIVPLVNYEDVSPLINRMMNGEKNVLVSKDIKNYEKTSGSSMSIKYIPYTEDILLDFTEMFQYWSYDVLTKGPKFKTGTFYFSVSPHFQSDIEIKGTSIPSLNSDEDYLSGWTKYFLKPFFAINPDTLKKIQDPQEFKEMLFNRLKSNKNLEIISIWNPSFLTSLLKTRTFSAKEAFPELKFISCWGDSLAKYDMAHLKKIFPHVLIQPKGLLATEAPITLPLIDAPAPVPLVGNVFLEFKCPNGLIKRLHELVDSEIYDLIISQKSGLYRYVIGDRVQVKGFYKNTPCLIFVGRSGQISDLVGEKISESYIEAFFQTSEMDSFEIIIPSQKNKRYYIIGQDNVHDKALESFLMESHHYQNARKLGQLYKVEKIKITENLESYILDFFELKRGMKRGDVKFRRLYSQEWDEQFLNYLLKFSDSK